jgi:deoxyribonuclease-4
MLGSNVPMRGGLASVFRYGDEWGCECIQIYLTASRRWHVTELSEKEVAEFNLARQKSRVRKVIAHVPFLVNLASPSKEARLKSIHRLGVEASRAERLSVPFLVLHPGSCRSSGKQDGINWIVQGLDAVSEKLDSSVKILLETTAGQGNVIGSRFEDIRLILDGVQRQDCLGVCFDTAHVFMAGYDIRSPENYESTMQIFDDVVGLKRVEVIHLNDSKSGLFSRNDRHASIGEGRLGLPFFRTIVTDFRFADIPMILEIPERDRMSKTSLQLLRTLQKLGGTTKPAKMGLQASLESFSGVKSTQV